MTKIKSVLNGVGRQLAMANGCPTLPIEKFLFFKNGTGQSAISHNDWAQSTEANSG